jgi:hypothetical protein
MNKKRNIAIGCCCFVVALLLAVYGADFSWRNVIVVGIALFLWSVGEDVWKAAFTPRPFTRLQFRIGISHIGLALQEAGLYGDELSEAVGVIVKGMTGRGWIIFTWLEPELFYVNTTNQYSSKLEIDIDLPMYGAREPKHSGELSDMIEMRSTVEGYELVLLTREERYSWPDMTRGKGLVLFKLPYKFLYSLQGDPLESHKKVSEVLATSGFTYHSDAEVWNAWDYRNKYGSLKWWDV